MSRTLASEEARRASLSRFMSCSTASWAWQESMMSFTALSEMFSNNYTLASPIRGTIVDKLYKTGDTVESCPVTGVWRLSRPSRPRIAPGPDK